jgi:hypothetical protein
VVAAGLSLRSFKQFNLKYPPNHIQLNPCDGIFANEKQGLSLQGYPVYI